MPTFWLAERAIPQTRPQASCGPYGLTNVHPVCDALNDLSAALGTLRELIHSGNAEAIESLLERGQRRKRKFAEDGSAAE
ncbi:MAG: hypothetical protein ACLFVH_14555 [Phycisphaerae bacterium]